MGQPGAPLPFGRQVPEVVLNAVGDFEEGEGAQISIAGEHIILKGAGAEFIFMIKVHELLEAIGEYNRQHES